MSSRRLVLQLLECPRTFEQLLKESGLSAHNLHQTLYRLRDEGLLVSVPETFHRADLGVPTAAQLTIDNPVIRATIATFPNN